MTDIELIKALDNKVHGSDYACFEDYEILALIKRQQTEIKKLEEVRQRQAELLSELRAKKYELMKRMSRVKNEAYKEFAEKATITLTNACSSEYAHWIDNTLYNLLKELVGENE